MRILSEFPSDEDIRAMEAAQQREERRVKRHIERLRKTSIGCPQCGMVSAGGDALILHLHTEHGWPKRDIIDWFAINHPMPTSFVLMPTDDR